MFIILYVYKPLLNFIYLDLGHNISYSLSKIVRNYVITYVILKWRKKLDIKIGFYHTS